MNTHSCTLYIQRADIRSNPLRDYFNAKVAYHDSPDEPVEIIIKVGAVDSVDDMYVDEYVSARADLETIKKEGHPDFALIDYWKNPAPTVDIPQEPVLEPARTMIANDIGDWLTSSGEYADQKDELSF
ncbi:hypothetical protein SAMN05192540_1529 [Maribacter dokdonensis]|uniref:Uncharacterized protein n=1 Tax=Maribacter dokdonensis TaxID=320912 RepID=A0A1H4M5Z8_9FLAO|nr:hypothetical protein [Maribacter dokdonensis]SEB78227.1 hypothetical protein SAMN05192540_1529 [Maribacter dokdonensis]